MTIGTIARATVVFLALLAVGACQPASDNTARERPLKPMESDETVLPSLGPGWELVPHSAYAASQSPGQVIIRASGENPTGGFETALVQSPVRTWPPQYRLVRKKPEGMATQVITPFEVSASFNAKDPILSVTVLDGQGLHRVPVDQARD